MPPETGKWERQKKRRKGAERRLEVDCGNFTFAVFFLVGTKVTKKVCVWRRGGGGAVNTNVLQGSVRPHKKQNGSVNKK